MTPLLTALAWLGLQPPRQLVLESTELARVLSSRVLRLNDVGLQVLADSGTRQTLRREISRIPTPSRNRQRRITLNNATSITPASPARTAARTVSIRGSLFDANITLRWVSFQCKSTRSAFEEGQAAVIDAVTCGVDDCWSPVRLHQRNLLGSL